MAGGLCQTGTGRFSTEKTRKSGQNSRLSQKGQSSTILFTGCLLPPKMTINLLTNKTTQGKHASFKSELAGLQSPISDCVVTAFLSKVRFYSG
jgi:hypothetical protein